MGRGGRWESRASFGTSGCLTGGGLANAPPQLKLFEKAEPGDPVQVDEKFVKIAGR